MIVFSEPKKYFRKGVSMRKSVHAAMLLLFIGGALFGQSESASIVGTVMDSSGAALPGVTISIRNTQTNATFNAQSAGDGNYTSPPLQPGSYSVTAEAQGFSKMVQNLNLDVDHTARLGFC